MPVATCPRCDTRIRIPSDPGDKPVTCPKCRQPFTEQRWEEPSAEEEQRSSPAKKPRPRDEDDDVPIRSKRSAARPNLVLPLAVGSALLVGLCAGVGGTLLVVQAGGSGSAVPAFGSPSATREGEQWTYRELRDYFERNGLKCRMLTVEGGMCFVDTADDSPNHVIQFNADNGRWQDVPGFLVQQHDDARSARDRAGRRTEGTHSWGRFYFRGDDTYIAQVRKLLR